MIGLFGGTFDPPHIGHLVLADEARYELGLEKVLWIVTGEPPHKPDRPITAVKHRVEMVKRCIKGDPNFELSMLEIDRPGPHYAADTLNELVSTWPEDRWAYIMGKDSLRDLPQWHTPQRFVELVDAIIVLNRTDVEADVDQLNGELPGLKVKLHYLDVPIIDVASRDVRRRVANSNAFRYLVPHGVADYIESEGLYR